MPKIRIIGVSAYFHDAAVCLIEDGLIIYTAQEERFSRIKNDSNFPKLALADCLKTCHVKLSDIHYFVYYEKPFLKFERLLSTYIKCAPKGFLSFTKAMNTWSSEKIFIKQNIYKALKNIDPFFNKKRSPLLFSTHHLSHAASAFFPSSFQSAAILTIDGVGEYTTTSIGFGDGNNIKILKEIHFPHSIGLLYSSITYFLGFKVNSDEYKVMGLAAYGNPSSDETQRFISIIENNLIALQPGGSYQLNLKHFTYEHALTMVNATDWQQLFGIEKRVSNAELTQSHCNLAYAFQKITEKAVLNLCVEAKRLTHSENLCLAGGVALNSVINGIIKDSNLFKNIFIQPAAGDAGGALGAALAAYHIFLKHDRIIQYPDGMQNSLLGNTIPKEEIAQLCNKHSNHFVCKDEDELCSIVAKHILEGKVIGWCQGKMEFGPRALGNRSILADATNPNMQKHVNLKIKNRESFRPFAPAVLEEDAVQYFELSSTSPYMLQVHNVKPEYLKAMPKNYNNFSMNEKLHTVKSLIPAVTHVDFSARIQTVNKNQHPLFWKLIDAYKQLSGYGLLINTSFNVKDEPIVCSTTDAYTCFKQTGMDILVIEHCIFYK